MAETLRLEIVTPQAIVFSEDVDMVTLPAVEGQIGVYPQHVRLITQVVPGEIIVHQGRRRSSFLAVGEGLVEIDRRPRGDRDRHGHSGGAASTKPRSRRRARAPRPGCARRSPTRKSRPSTPRSSRSLAQLQVRRRRKV